MKKKLLLITTIIFVALVSTACGNNKKNHETTSAIQNVSSEVTKESPEETTQKELSLSDVEKSLTSYLTGERTEMVASFIGAEQGFKYSSDGLHIEIYEYDVNSDEYKELCNNGYVEIEGFDGVTMNSSAINGKFVLFIEEYPGDKAELINAFNNLK